MDKPLSKELILLHPRDNVVVCRSRVDAGTPLVIDGEAVVASVTVELGHKLARWPLAVGEKAIKFGAPIGSITQAVVRGAHVHLHNMKSDYIPAHTRQADGRKS